MALPMLIWERNLGISNCNEAILSFFGWFVFFYLYNGLGLTLGYHRLLTHRGLQVPRWIAYILVSGSYLLGMGGPIPWVGSHRLHHQKADQDGDPHSPKDGFNHAMLGWVFSIRELQPDEELQKQTRDLMSDPFYRFLGTEHSARQAYTCVAACIVFRLIILAVFGPAAFWASVVTWIIGFLSSNFVNTICHMPDHGYRPHDVSDMSRNVWWVAILGLGEGWHNNHHAFPRSARHGLRWYEIDVTWYAIWLLQKLGLAKAIILPPKTVKQPYAKPETLLTSVGGNPVSAEILLNKE